MAAVRAGLRSKEFEKLLDRVRGYREGLLRPAVVRQEERPAAAQPAAPRPAAATPAQTEEPIVATIVSPARVKAASQTPAVVPAAKPQAVRSPVIAKPQAAETGCDRPNRRRRARSWSEMLAGFMEERNIRWGELIGGLLIVGPAIALVISFWEQLAANPYLQLSTFVATCSAVFGVGLYAHHRWKLRSTSLGLLIIATLLVPLCFLAMAAVWKENWGPGTIAADLVTLAIFTALVLVRRRGCWFPSGPWLQVIAVLGGSASTLVAAHWVGRRVGRLVVRFRRLPAGGVFCGGRRRVFGEDAAAEAAYRRRCRQPFHAAGHRRVCNADRVGDDGRSIRPASPPRWGECRFPWLWRRCRSWPAD